jgi:hypothetical protein
MVRGTYAYRRIRPESSRPNSINRPVLHAAQPTLRLLDNLSFDERSTWLHKDPVKKSLMQLAPGLQRMTLTPWLCNLVDFTTADQEERSPVNDVLQ